MHEPLSQKLAQVLQTNSAPDGITLNQLLEKTEGRGFYLVVILLALPFIVPLAIPGVSTVLGLSIAFLSLRLAFGRIPRLPRSMGDKKLSPAFQKKVLGGSVKFLRLVEKLVKPRRTPWMATRPARFANALLMMFLGLLLALPFPGIPPLTNSLPCYSIILLAASMMEEDGVTIWIAYALSLVTTIYLVAILGVLEEAIVRGYRAVRHWLQP
jgi:hypothetical protein